MTVTCLIVRSILCGGAAAMDNGICTVKGCIWTEILMYMKNLRSLSAMQPTAGLVEIEPSMAWNPSVVSGIGVVENVDTLYNDMHAYLASAGEISSAFLSSI